MGYEPSFSNQGSYAPLDLIAGDFPLKTETIVLEKGQNLKRGALLGQKNEGGKYILSSKSGTGNAAVADGSETPKRILAEDVNAVDKDKTTVGYLTGSFYRGGITLGKGHTIESVKPDLELRSIYIEG